MKKIMIVGCFFLTASCQENKKNDPVNITIAVGQSYQYNISEDTYTVYFLNKPETVIKLDLTEKEKKEINQIYYSLDIDEIKSDLEIKDGCNTMPKIYTVVSVKKPGNSVKLQIDDECNDFDSARAKKLKEFVTAVKKILNQKNNIKSAPKSDVIYL